ncbi:MAG TPA: DNA repair protein RecN [Solirubrobacteraceae bacterium]|nr:DNA repair protein RecN [Solirubrobacteraceae bacterium]
MLYELRVENLLLMERAELRLAPGLNMLTGETGAGKTLLAHALDLLLGGRARRGIVRPGAAEAYVEGVFELPPALAGSERLPTGVEEIVLARRVWPDGRTRAYVCGRAATQADLQELGSQLLSFYGQHEHRKLMLSASQLEVLDAYCGAEQLALRGKLRAAYEHVREREQRAAGLRELAGARDRELDLLTFELQEIEAAAPSEAEQASLTTERDRLRHQEALAQAAVTGIDAIAGAAGAEGGGGGAAGSVARGAAELLAQAAVALDHAAAMDERLMPLAERAETLRYEAEDVAGELRGYLLELEGGAGEAGGAARLEEIEERLAVLARLERKHGGTVADVLAHAERCRSRRSELENADSALDALEAELLEARSDLERLAQRIGKARRKAAPRLAGAVRARLAELAMAEARFEIELSARPDGCGPRGADAIEMLIAPNAGGPLGPLREVASGGELSRVMLALLSIAHDMDDNREQTRAGVAKQLPKERGALLVFDEIDAGIGGLTARAVGEHLRQLSRDRQVLCITHLPQVAALADRHFTIVKDAAATPATTTVTALDGDQVVGELVRMLGGGSEDRAASEHARELLRAA